MNLEKIIEALLFSAQKPLSIHEIAAAIKGAEGDLASETPNEFKRAKSAEVAAAHSSRRTGTLVPTEVFSSHGGSPRHPRR